MSYIWGRMVGSELVHGFGESNMGTFEMIAFTDEYFKEVIDKDNEYDLNDMELFEYAGDERNSNRVVRVIEKER